MGRWLMTLMLVMVTSLATRAVEAYACYTPENTTLTFYYDDLRASRPGTTYDLDEEIPGWYRDLLDMDTWSLPTTRVIIDPSFAGARPTSTYAWFGYMNKVQSITGISCLNTSKVTNMGSMFEGCSGLTNLDVSGFNTANVTNMQFIFYGCSGLTNLDLSNFNTANVTTMEGMFDHCSALTSLDLSGFNTARVTEMSWMFFECSNLTTIYTGSGWKTNAVTSSNVMFSGCTSLVGGMGTTYDASHTDAAYAHIDGGPSNPGYFTAAIIRGDVNGDGQVKINDVTALINFLLTHNGTGINLHGADANQSGGINISDVTFLINYLLSGSW